MESNDQTPGQPAPAVGGPAPVAPVAPAAPAAPQTSPPPQASGQPAQDERYWQGQHDKIVNSSEYKQGKQLYDLYGSYKQEDGTNPLVDHTKTFFNPGGPSTPQPGFDPSVDFDANDLSNPNSPTGKYFNSHVEQAIDSRVDQKLQKLEQVQQRQSYEQYLTAQKGYTPDQAKGYVDLLMNPSPEFVQEFLMGKAADAFVAAPQGAPAPPAGPGLGPVSATQAALPATGQVQGAQPAPKSEADALFDRIQNAGGSPLPLKQ